MTMEYESTVTIETSALILSEEDLGEAETLFMQGAVEDTPNGVAGKPRLIKICHRLNKGTAEYTFAVELAAPAPKKATPSKVDKTEEGV